MNTTNTPASAWAQFGEVGENESMLVGNREGLTILRDAIDQAIETGEGQITVEEVEFAGVRCRDGGPHVFVESNWSKFFGFGCLIVVAVCFLIFLVGLARIATLIFE